MPEKGPLYDFVPQEIMPPAEVWGRIAVAVNEAELVTTFSQLALQEAEPPLKVWEQISKSLDNTNEAPVFAAANSLEAAPPAAIWQQIEAALDGAKVLPMAPPQRKYRNLWLAAAAVFIGAIILVSSLYISSNEIRMMADNLPARMKSAIKSADSQVRAGQAIKEPVLASNLPANTAEANNTDNHFIEAKSLNGNTVKVSAKLAPMLELLSKENIVTAKSKPALPAAEAGPWKQKLKRWTAAINSPGANPAAINFADPIDLIRFLQKKK